MSDATPPPPLEFADADRLLPAIWHRLRSKPFRTQTLATIGRDGAPQARSVILRTVEPAERRIECHTDRTSPKFAELRRDPRAAWLAWDEGERLQLRLDTLVTLHTDDAIADAMWRSQSSSNLAVYRVAREASVPVGGPEEVRRLDAPDRDRFAVIRATVQSLEWLSLADADQHRRGRFTFAANGVARHAFLVP